MRSRSQASGTLSNNSQAIPHHNTATARLVRTDSGGKGARCPHGPVLIVVSAELRQEGLQATRETRAMKTAVMYEALFLALVLGGSALAGAEASGRTSSGSHARTSAPTLAVMATATR